MDGDEETVPVVTGAEVALFGALDLGLVHAKDSLRLTSAHRELKAGRGQGGRTLRPLSPVYQVIFARPDWMSVIGLSTFSPGGIQMATPLKSSTCQNSALFFDAAVVRDWNQTSFRTYCLRRSYTSKRDVSASRTVRGLGRGFGRTGAALIMKVMTGSSRKASKRTSHVFRRFSALADRQSSTLRSHERCAGKRNAYRESGRSAWLVPSCPGIVES